MGSALPANAVGAHASVTAATAMKILETVRTGAIPAIFRQVTPELEPP